MVSDFSNRVRKVWETRTISTSDLGPRSVTTDLASGGQAYDIGRIRDRLRDELGVSRELGTLIEAGFPFLRHIRSIDINTCNRVATCYVVGERTPLYLKITTPSQGEVELAALKALHEIRSLSRFVPKIYRGLSSARYGGGVLTTSDAVVFATQSRNVHVSPEEARSDEGFSTRFARKLKTLGRVHAHSVNLQDKIEINLKQGLPFVDYGNVSSFIVDINGGMYGEMISEPFAAHLAAAFDRAQRTLSGLESVVLHRDPKDENWTPDGSCLLDWATVRRGPRSWDYARVLFDYDARDLTDVKRKEAIALLTRHECAARYHLPTVFSPSKQLVHDTYFHTQLSGIIGLTRMLRSNVLKKREDQTAQNRYYLCMLRALVEGYRGNGYRMSAF